MTNCDMWGALSDGTTVTIQDYYSTGENTPSTDVENGGTDDLVYVSGGLDSNGHIDVTFTRKLVTGDVNDQVIVPDLITHICWAYRSQNSNHGKNGNPQSEWQKHSSYSSGVFNFASKSSDLLFVDTNSDKSFHGALLSIAWIALAPVGIVAARFYKYSHFWILVHISCLLATSLITIISVSKIARLEEYNMETLIQNNLEHSRLGMSITSIVISQVLFGCFTSVFKILTKNHQAVSFITRFHKVVGYGLLVAGFINCIKGWSLYGGGGAPLVLVIGGIIIIILVFLCCESFQICYRNKHLAPATNLPITTHFEIYNRIKNGEELLFAEDLVVNVKHFKKSHPGGLFMIEKNIGEDAGKFMIGCKGYDDDYNPYTHSKRALSYLNKLAIAKIPRPVGFIAVLDNNVLVNPMEFVIFDKLQLNDHTFLIYLKSDFFKMSKHCLSPTWLGKHFKVISKNGVMRYYSCIFTDIIEWADQLGLVDTEKIYEEGLVKFIYKVYPGGKMTNYLASLKTGDSLKIQGPIGPGFLLQEHKGNYLAFAGGTGLVPFLDLVYYSAKLVNETKRSDLKLSLLVSFRTWKDGFALDILEKIKSLDEIGWLNLVLLHDASPNRKNVKDIVKNWCQQSIDLAWVCGPSGFNRFYNEMLLENGIDKFKIILM